MSYYKLVQVKKLKGKKTAFLESKGSGKGQSFQFLVARTNTETKMPWLKEPKVFRTADPRKTDYVFVPQILLPSTKVGLVCGIAGLVLGMLTRLL